MGSRCRCSRSSVFSWHMERWRIPFDDAFHLFRMLHSQHNNCELASKRCVVMNFHSSSKSKQRNEIIINDWMYRTQMGRSRVVDKSVSLQRQDDNTTENEWRDELTWRREKWRKSAHRSRASCSDSARVRRRTRAESDRKLHKWH